MVVFLKTRRVGVALATLFFVSAVAACQRDPGSGSVALNGGGVDPSFDPNMFDSWGLGATCHRVSSKATAEATGTDRDYAERFLRQALVNKVGIESDQVDSKYEIVCKSLNMKSQTNVTCRAYERSTDTNQWVTKTIYSNQHSSQRIISDVLAESYLKKVLEGLQTDGKTVLQNPSISKVPDRDIDARNADSGEKIWKLTYQVPGC